MPHNTSRFEKEIEDREVVSTLSGDGSVAEQTHRVTKRQAKRARHEARETVYGRVSMDLKKNMPCVVEQLGNELMIFVKIFFLLYIFVSLK